MTNPLKGRLCSKLTIDPKVTISQAHLNLVSMANQV